MSKPKILIVEDEMIVALEIQSNLYMADYKEVEIASTKDEAMKSVISNRPDLVLMDISLYNEPSGIDAANKIRIKYDIPVIFITAISKTETFREALETQPFGYIVKPYKLHELLATIEVALSKHQYEKRLKESEQRLKAIIHNTSAGYFFIDKNGLYQDVNASWLKMHGDFAKEEVIGKHFSISQTDRDLKKAESTFQRVIKGEAIPFGSFSRRNKDGSTGYHSFSINPVYKEGEIVGLEGFLIDETKRMQDQVKIHNYQKNINNIVENIDVGILVTDETGKIIFVNTAMQRLFNKDKKSLLNSNFGYPLASEKYTEIEIIKSPGKTGDAEMRVNRIKWDGKTSFFITITDITERKQAEEALREYERALEGVRDMIFVVDESYRFSLANKSFLDKLSLERSKIYEYHLRDVFGNDVFKEDMKQYIDSCFRGESHESQMTHTSSNLGKLDLQASYYPINIGEDIKKAVVILRDITVLKHTEEALHNLAYRLQNIREEERKAIAREIHDNLGQSLTAIKIDLCWVKNKLSSIEDTYLRKIDSAIELCDSLIDSVGRISTELRPETLDDLGLAPAIEWQTEEFQNRTGVRCILKTEEISSTLDSRRSTALFRIYQELMTNIFRHAKATKVNITLKQKKENIELSIKDNGVGITDEHVNSSKSIGIIGMRERLLPLQGHIEFHGIAKKGTAVKVTLPAKRRKND